MHQRTLRQLLIALCCMTCLPVRPAGAQAQKPNIIFILADDLGYGDVGCYGQRQIQTPSIDRLASDGVRFTQAYAGAPICAPSRCALITGLHTGHCLVRGNGRQNLRPDDLTIAEALKPAGYSTALIGKWGLGDEGTTGLPTRQGFDSFFGYLNQGHAHNAWPTFLIRNEQRVKLRNVVPDERADGRGVASSRVDFSNDLMHQEVLSYIDQHKGGARFFLFVAYTLPHANNEAHVVEVPDLGIYKDRDWPEPHKAYAAAVTLLDRYVGEIVERVKQGGIDNETIIFFASDNGPHIEGSNDPRFFQSSGPLRGIKRDTYDGGIRVPMIARWPGHIEAGRISEQVWAFWDFLPTAAELAGAKVPAGIDGISALPAILGRPQTQRHEYLYWELHENGFKQAIRVGDWKGVRLAPNQPIELYDLAHDIGETTDVAAQHPAEAERMTRLFKAARTDSPDWPVRE
jgi:arylsulfatase A-like enzyme